jgi:hypothetical protein
VRRVLTLTFDMIVVHGDRRRVALVGRALVMGDAKIVGHAVVPLATAPTDRGDARGGSSTSGARPAVRQPSTAVLTEEQLQAARRAATPFGGTPSSNDSQAANPAPSPQVPATPFDKHFQAVKVTPGIGVSRTVSQSDDDQASARAKIEAAMRKVDARAAEPAAVPVAGAPAAPAPAPKEPAAKPVIATPKPGAMAKPRVRRR